MKKGNKKEKKKIFFLPRRETLTLVNKGKQSCLLTTSSRGGGGQGRIARQCACIDTGLYLIVIYSANPCQPWHRKWGMVGQRRTRASLQTYEQSLRRTGSISFVRSAL
jgi:hypothetical protein